MFKNQSVTDVVKEYEEQKAKVKNRFFIKLSNILDNSLERLVVINKAKATLWDEEEVAKKDHVAAQAAIQQLLKD